MRPDRTPNPATHSGAVKATLALRMPPWLKPAITVSWGPNAMACLHLRTKRIKFEAALLGFLRIDARATGGERDAKPGKLARSKRQGAARQQHQGVGVDPGREIDQVGLRPPDAMQQQQQGFGLNRLWLPASGTPGQSQHLAAIQKGCLSTVLMRPPLYSGVVALFRPQA